MSKPPHSLYRLCGGFVNLEGMMNSHIALRPRLAAAARLAAGTRILADVGCDHGLLSIYMLTHGGAERAVASDLRPGPLEAARRNAAGLGLGDRIRFELCDGLEYPGADEADMVVIAGMGGETICGILARAPWTREGARLVLQPQSKIDELCRWLNCSGYALQSALLAREGERLYLALCARGGSGGFDSAEEALLESADPLLAEWLDLKIAKARKALDGMESAASVRDTAALRGELEKLNEMRRILL